jgi:hypothetical protein
VFRRRRGLRDVDDRSGRADQTDGQKTENLSDFAGLLRSAIAAPSMKAALEAWGADSNLFHQGAANESAIRT